MLTLPKQADKEEAPKVEEVISSTFVPAIEAAISEYVARWQDRDETDNFAQHYDEELVREELRPLVFEEVRKQVRAGSAGHCVGGGRGRVVLDRGVWAEDLDNGCRAYVWRCPAGMGSAHAVGC